MAQLYECRRAMPTPPLTVVPWATATDEELVAIVNAYYDGTLSLDDIKAVWSIGDEREVQLSAMAATGVGESHAAQTVKFVIMNWGGKTLNDGNDTECLAIVGQKDCLAEEGYMNSAGSNYGGWDSCARRTWCNNVYKAALPSHFISIFKEHQNKASAGNTSSTITTSNDYFTLPAEIEVFGSTSQSFVGEGTQFDYYKTSNNRIKKKGKLASAWWERSPLSNLSNAFLIVQSDGAGNNTSANYTRGIAPFGVI